jgi:hypothetical protein
MTVSTKDVSMKELAKGLLISLTRPECTDGSHSTGGGGLGGGHGTTW